MMRSDAGIRRAVPGDRPDLLPLLRGFSDHFGFVWDEARKLSVLDRILAAPELGQVWLVYEEGSVAGYAVVVFHLSLEFNGCIALLDEFWIAPAARGSGWGSRLLARMAAALADEGTEVLRLEIDEGHRRAAGLYGRHGFRREPRELWSRRLAARRGTDGLA